MAAATFVGEPAVLALATCGADAIETAELARLRVFTRDESLRTIVERMLALAFAECLHGPIQITIVRGGHDVLAKKFHDQIASACSSSRWHFQHECAWSCRNRKRRQRWLSL